MLNILVCVKQVPDTAEVSLDENHSLVRDFVAQVMNPADESALECALSIKNSADASVTIMTMGKPAAEGMLREAAARGADRLILLTDGAFAGADTLATAKTLCAAVRKSGPYDLILCGRRAIDGETGQVGPALAALLNIPVVTNAVAISLDAAGGAECTQLVEDGSLIWHVPQLPLLATFCEWSLPLRLPSIMGLRRARDTQALHWGLDDVALSRDACGLRGSPTRVIRVHAQPSGLRACAFTTIPELFAKGVLP